MARTYEYKKHRKTYRRVNAYTKSKSSEGAAMVEVWLCRIQEQNLASNTCVHATTKMYTMAVDVWAKLGEKGAAVRAESLLQHMYNLYPKDKAEILKSTIGIFNSEDLIEGVNKYISYRIDVRW